MTLQPVFSDDTFAPGRVSFNSLSLDPAISPAEQAWNADLDEDLVSVSYPGRVCLDVGWYPSHNPAGAFTVVVNEDPYSWEPSISKSCKTLSELRAIVQQMVEIARTKSRASRWLEMFSEEDFAPGYLAGNHLLIYGEMNLAESLAAYPPPDDKLLDARLPGNYYLEVCRRTQGPGLQLQVELSSPDTVPFKAFQRMCHTQEELRFAVQEAMAIWRRNTASK